MANTFKQKRKKVNAIQWNGENADEVSKFLGEGTATKSGRSLIVSTKFMTALLNDKEYLIKDGDKLSAMDEKTFKDTYKEEDNGK